MIEVLMYLFENYMDANIRMEKPVETIAKELCQVGFLQLEVDGALTWLQELTQLDQAAPITPVHDHVLRHFAPEEAQLLDIDCQRFLLDLQQAEIITPTMRENIIERIFALGMHDVSLAKVKWVALMVILSKPCDPQALVWIQDFVLNTQTDQQYH